MIVADVMTRNPLFVHPDMSVPDARALIKKEKVGRLPVLDRENRLVGIVTEWDLVNASPSVATTLDIYEMGFLLSKLKVEQVMERSVITVTEDTVIEEAARIMDDHHISALPVMRSGLLVGIISDGDIFRIFIELFGARQEGVRLTMLVPEQRGELHNITHAVMEKGGDIIALVISDGEDVSNKTCILKVANVAREELLAAVKPYAIKIEDIR